MNSLQELKIIKSSIIKSIIFNNYSFQQWKYATVIIFINWSEIKSSICMNTKCIVSLVSREFFLTLSSKIIIKNILLILMQDIKKIKSSIKIAIFLFNFSATFYRKFIIMQIHTKIHIVDNLKINLFIEIDNLILNKIFINLAKQITTFRKCQNAEIVLFITVKADHQIS